MQVNMSDPNLKVRDVATKTPATAGWTSPPLKASTDTFTAPHKTLPPAPLTIYYFGRLNNQKEIMVMLYPLVVVYHLIMTLLTLNRG